MPSPLEVIPPKVVSRDSSHVCTGVTQVGLCKGLETGSGVNHVGGYVNPVDDVVSIQHEPDELSIQRCASLDTSCNDLDSEGRIPIHVTYEKTMESSVQSQRGVSTLFEPGSLHTVKDCSLLYNNQQHQQEDQDLTKPDTGFNDILSVVLSPLGKSVTVYGSCAVGKCSCEYVIGKVPCQLKPCRFAAVILSSEEWSKKYLVSVSGVTFMIWGI